MGIESLVINCNHVKGRQERMFVDTTRDWNEDDPRWRFLRENWPDDRGPMSEEEWVALYPGNK